MHPIIFNPLKHHADHICQYIKSTSWENWADEIELIGNSVVDIYTGSLSAETVTTEIMTFLESENLASASACWQWLEAHHNYRIAMLSDGSLWVLRKGTSEADYVHIHPGRQSPFTLRISANTLKTAITCGLCLLRGDISDLSLPNVNLVRTRMLSLSAIRTLRKGTSLASALDRFVMA